MIDLCKIHNSC